MTERFALFRMNFVHVLIEETFWDKFVWIGVGLGISMDRPGVGKAMKMVRNDHLRIRKNANVILTRLN
jgi:hypothetical protein